MASVLVEVLLKLAEIGAGLGAGIWFKRAASGAPAGMEFVVGIGATLLALISELQVRSALRYREHQRKLDAMAESLGLAARQQHRMQLALSKSGRTLDPAETMPTWRDLTWCVHSRYRATNYIDIEHFYDTGAAQKTIAVQKAKILAQDVAVQKVFIYDEKSEFSSPVGQKLLQDHKDAGVTMRFIARGVITATLAPQLRKLEAKNLDFAIFDSDVVLVWHLGSDRKMLDSEVLVGDTVVGRFDDFFRALWDQAEGEPR
jgi:hypothetical protein